MFSVQVSETVVVYVSVVILMLILTNGYDLCCRAFAAYMEEGPRAPAPVQVLVAPVVSSAAVIQVPATPEGTSAARRAGVILVPATPVGTSAARQVPVTPPGAVSRVPETPEMAAPLVTLQQIISAARANADVREPGPFRRPARVRLPAHYPPGFLEQKKRSTIAKCLRIMNGEPAPQRLFGTPAFGGPQRISKKGRSQNRQSVHVCHNQMHCDYLRYQKGIPCIYDIRRRLAPKERRVRPATPPSRLNQVSLAPMEPITEEEEFAVERALVEEPVVEQAVVEEPVVEEPAVIVRAPRRRTPAAASTVPEAAPRRSNRLRGVAAPVIPLPPARAPRGSRTLR